MLLSATKTHNFWPLRQDIKILKTDLYYSLFFNSPCNLWQCPYSNQVHGHQPSWGWEEACFVKEALSQPLLEAVTRHKESIQGRQIKGHTGGARVHRRGEKFNKFGGVLSPSFSSSLTLSHISSTFSSWFYALGHCSIVGQLYCKCIGKKIRSYGLEKSFYVKELRRSKYESGRFSICALFEAPSLKWPSLPLLPLYIFVMLLLPARLCCIVKHCDEAGAKGQTPFLWGRIGEEGIRKSSALLVHNWHNGHW